MSDYSPHLYTKTKILKLENTLIYTPKNKKKIKFKNSSIAYLYASRIYFGGQAT
nr:MAG TPA: hypothetical protein [Bacteriophage sp.]